MKKSTRVSMMATLAAAMLIGQAAFAQGGTGTDANVDSGDEATGTRTEQRRDESPDMGWLGLLGLAGLAGLLKKPERQVVHQTDTRHSPTTTR